MTITQAPYGAAISSAAEPASFPSPARALAYLYFSAAVLYYLTGSMAVAGLVQFLGISLFVLESLEPRRSAIPLYVLTTAAIVGLLARCVAHGNLTPLAAAPDLFAGAGGALALVHGRVDRRAIVLLFAIVMLMFVRAFVQGVIPAHVLPGRSRNHISVLVLSLVGALIFLDIDHDRTPGVAPALLGLTAAIWAVGRGGILAMSIVTAGVLWENRRRLRTRAGLAGLAVTTAVATVVFLHYRAAITFFLYLSTRKFRDRGFESNERMQILNEYVGGLDVKTFLFGQEDRIFAILGLTLHNSFILWHFLFGVLAVVPAYFAARALFRALKQKPIAAILLLAFLARALTDTVLWPGLLLDPVFLALVVRYAGHDVAVS